MSLARVRALVLVSALVVCALVLVVLAIIRDKQRGSSYSSSCPAGSVLIRTKPLPDQSTIKLNVYNGTSRVGLAAQAADDFRSRKFIIGQVKDIAKYAGIAQVRYGPKEVAAASVVNAYFLGDADMQFDIKRTDDMIDVVLGSQYRALGTPTDVNQAIAQLGNPSPPPGTCDIAR